MSMPVNVSEAPRSLEERLDDVAHEPRLLVACDYDGTLAPIVDDPAKALPVRESLVALRMLAQLEHTHVAVISGRPLADLASMTGFDGQVHLVGSHGSEFDVGFIDSLSPEEKRLRERLGVELKRIAEQWPGLLVEEKPASVALHYRMADVVVAAKAVDAVTQGPATWKGVTLKRGKKVLELAVVSTNKGEALQRIRQRLGVGCVVFLGDDVTDEDAFGTLSGPDVGVKVGEGQTIAAYRVVDTHEVARLLGRLAERRAAWLSGEDITPIERHSILSDQRAVALVTDQARITWLCAPRVDSPSIFAELVGGAPAGYFSVEPEDGSEAVGQEYVDRSLVLRTRFREFEVVDYLDCSAGRARQRAGRTDLVRVLRGKGRVRVTFAPRLDFSRTITQLQAEERGLSVLDSPDPVSLHSEGVRWEIKADGRHHLAEALIDLAEGPVALTMRIGAAALRPASSEDERLTETLDFWRHWADKLRAPRLAREQVIRSALTLRSLAHGPTGAISGAATTSLPEAIGGVRNWDYRYCWPRDSAMAAMALLKLGSSAEAMHLLDWLLTVVERAVAPDRLAPVYTVTGEELSTEGEIGELRGYAGSRPVRIGNAASRQVQLDVFGPVVELVYELALRDAPLTPHHWRVVEAMVSAVHARWDEPDHGVWEIRAEPAHHVHSRVMCWVTIDRAMRAAELAMHRIPHGWAELREQIRQETLERGWSEEVGAFTAAYGASYVDASTLVIGLSGMVAPDDERFVRTVEAIERELLEWPAVYRYRYDDGLPGTEGGFNLCTCWLILAYELTGRRADAMRLFEAYLGLVGPTGLMAEEYCPRSKLALGNIPQAYSHAGLIECALALSEEAPGHANGALGARRTRAF